MARIISAFAFNSGCMPKKTQKKKFLLRKIKVSPKEKAKRKIMHSLAIALGNGENATGNGKNRENFGNPHAAGRAPAQANPKRKGPESPVFFEFPESVDELKRKYSGMAPIEIGMKLGILHARLHLKLHPSEPIGSTTRRMIRKVRKLERELLLSRHEQRHIDSAARLLAEAEKDGTI